MTQLSIIIVNYNTHDLLAESLRSIWAARGTLTAEVWVVDNASTDGSEAMVRADFPDVRLIVNEQNVGFARANNQALRQATGTVWLLLNPDTCVRPGALEAICAAFVRQPDAGIIAPQLLNADGTLQPSCGRFASAWTEFVFQTFLFRLLPSAYPLGKRVHPWQWAAYHQARPVDWASGACLAIRRVVAEQAGLLDETIFMYGEDMEWCWRVRQAGYAVWYWPEAQIVHYGQQASHQDYGAWIVRYTMGHLGFVTRCRSPLTARLTALFICIGSLLRIGLWRGIRLVRPTRRVEAEQRAHGYARAFALGWRVFWGNRLTPGVVPVKQ
jgi:hypothetical protein